MWLQVKIQPDEIDRIISAKLPDKEHDTLLFDMAFAYDSWALWEFSVTSLCMNSGRCSKKYSQNFVKHMQTVGDGYPT